MMDSIKYPFKIFRTSRSVNVDIKKLLAELRSHVNKGLHLGSGDIKIPHLINCDLFNPQADLKIDAINLETFEDNSIDLIETHHMIEHLSFKDAETALKGWHRVLRMNGLLIMTCPDITRICREWLLYSMIDRIFPCPKKRGYILKMLLGSQEDDGMFHKSAYDARMMVHLLGQYGFTVEFTYTPYPRRTTPSLLIIARKIEPIG